MERKNEFLSIGEYNSIFGLGTLHPLVNAVNFSKSKPIRAIPKSTLGFYTVSLKEGKGTGLKYGRNYYDFDEGTLVFFAPGQVLEVEEQIEEFIPTGRAVQFHPDFIHNTSLGQNIYKYTFFSYEVHEALHLSEIEKNIVLDCLLRIESELKHPIDKHSKSLIISYIELLLNYSIRFYDRQFITRSDVNHDILMRFERILNEYFFTSKQKISGLPSVKYCADKLYVSPNYLGDLIKKETGKSPQEHIQLKVINLAKERIFEPGKSISEVAYELGFKHPQHLSKLFKQLVGLTPLEYKSFNKLN